MVVGETALPAKEEERKGEGEVNRKSDCRVVSAQEIRTLHNFLNHTHNTRLVQSAPGYIERWRDNIIIYKRTKVWRDSEKLSSVVVETLLRLCSESSSTSTTAEKVQIVSEHSKGGMLGK